MRTRPSWGIRSCADRVRSRADVACILNGSARCHAPIRARFQLFRTHALGPPAGRDLRLRGACRQLSKSLELNLSVTEFSAMSDWIASSNPSSAVASISIVTMISVPLYDPFGYVGRDQGPAVRGECHPTVVPGRSGRSPGSLDLGNACGILALRVAVRVTVPV